MKRDIFVIVFLFVLALPIGAQEKELEYEVNLSTGLSSDTTLPFWLASNRFGTVPNSDYVLLNTSVLSLISRLVSLIFHIK